MKQINVQELKQKLDRKDDFVLLDVREDFEREICKLTPDVHIPMNEIQERFHELPKDKEIVVYCRSGARSMNVCMFLQSQGFKSLQNLSGGILSWADQIDSSIQKY